MIRLEFMYCCVMFYEFGTIMNKTSSIACVNSLSMQFYLLFSIVTSIKIGS